jgi:uncharacterized membrane protein YeiH
MLFSTLDIIGTVAFAISGSLTAIEKRFDVFGITIIAIATALGGGTLRDMLIGNTPVTWLVNLQNFYIVLITVSITILLRKQLNKLRISLMLFDTIGIGIFTLIGLQKGLAIELPPLACVLLGTVTACFGGVIRDILCNDVPVIFSKEVYATACMFGGVVFFVAQKYMLLDSMISIATILSIIVIRLCAIRLHWSLPQPKI